ncbi:hypothetical protein K7X08_022939 [Anisodus acutangulus]|uniref:TCP domain-containing protein n=1 Tax=Anisodus acutangulus TaxID=402998 RepID=A0A9Q1MBI8_9SOLA|nr:hypothetical protein K7X08_022939 [Anisodus acutangulus]
MNHQLQVSNEKEDKSSSSQEEEENEESFQENVQENQHLQKWANYFTPPNATLITKHQNNTQCPSHKEELKKVSQKRKPKEAKQDVMEVHGSRIVRATGRKDRHSKISTATGPKDRRVRLSPNTAIQFYDVQDRLGYDRPSQNQLFNYQREPLQSSSNFPQTISYSNIGFANDGLLVTSNAPIIQEEEEHGTLSSTLSAINATTLLHYQD